MSLKQMSLRHAGTCRVCGVELPAKTTAVYDFTAKNVICLGCRGEDAAAHQRTSPKPSAPGKRSAGDAGDRRSTDRRVGDRRRPVDAS